MGEQRSTVDLGLTGKVALVIGTGEGMGQAAVAELAAAGADVACFDLDEAAATAAARLVEAAGGRGLGLCGDATDRADIERAVAATREELGGIEVVVGVVGDGSKRGVRLHETDDSTWDQIVAVCLKPAVNVVRAAVGPMMEQGRGGSFTFISSIGGLSGLPGQAPYSAAKSGLMTLVKTLALEYGMEGIRFNAVAPGIVATPEIERISTAENRAEQGKQVPLRRMGRPQDVGRAIIFFASDYGDYVTGQTLAVDGGVTAKYQLPAFWADWEGD